MKHIILDDEEKDLMRSVENGEWQTVEKLQQEIERSKKIAEATMKKDERMNIRMTKRDMDALKIKALEEGMPYQTLVSSILHKYLAGNLVEK
jgi:predicted DNA binding CopG/RHH family protein